MRELEMNKLSSDYSAFICTLIKVEQAKDLTVKKSKGLRYSGPFVKTV